MVIDDYLQNCQVFLDCNKNGILDTDTDLPEISADALSSETGFVTFTFEDLQDQKAEEEGCLYTLDASNSACMNVGTLMPAEVSQVCFGEASDCTVISTMCTLVGYSSPEQINKAFGVDRTTLTAVPDMNFGQCAPCSCDPIAALHGRDPQVKGQVDGRTVIAGAQKQLAAITVTTAYVATVDFLIFGTSPSFSASESPGRQSLTEAINKTEGPLDLTKPENIVNMLNSAQKIGASEALVDMSSLAVLMGSCASWYHKQISTSDDNVRHLNWVSFPPSPPNLC